MDLRVCRRKGEAGVTEDHVHAPSNPKPHRMSMRRVLVGLLVLQLSIGKNTYTHFLSYGYRRIQTSTKLKHIQMKKIIFIYAKIVISHCFFFKFTDFGSKMFPY